jgi:stearoyl-CoA desaturase (Delta-9 desaturase)
VLEGESGAAAGRATQLRHPPPASRRHRQYNRFAVLFAHLAPLAAIVWIVAAASFGQWPSALDLGIFAGFFFLTMLGLEVGYHRYFAHGAFQTSRWLERVLAVLGSTAFHGGVIWWTATHKRHHAFSDAEGDPHSPYAAPRSGGARGFLFAHFGWMFQAAALNTGAWTRHVLPMYQDPFLFFLNRHYFLLSVLWLTLPAAAGGLLGGSLAFAWSAFLWGGLARVFLANHAIYSLNSFCHMFGGREFPQIKDLSSNNGWLALVTIGGSWHNNHHAFPRSASNCFRWWQLDIAAGVIWLLEKLGLVWNVYRPSKATVEARRLAGEGT